MTPNAALVKMGLDSLPATERDALLAQYSAPTSRQSRVLRFREVAERLGCSRRHVSNLLRAGAMRPVKMPGRSRCYGVAESEIDRLAGATA